MALKNKFNKDGVQENRPRLKADMKGKIKRATKKAQERVDAKIDKPKKGKTKVTYHLQCHAIQEAMQKGPLNVAQLAAKTGLSIARVQRHVEYEVGKGRANLNKKKQVIVNTDNQPRYKKVVG